MRPRVLALLLLALHVRILDLREWLESLLDGLGGGPLEHVVRTAGLVIRPCVSKKHYSTTQNYKEDNLRACLTRLLCPAEGLLSHDGSGRLVVHVKVAGAALQNLGALISERPRKEEKYIL